jgi:predicted RNase H-like HicB family nuclease
MSYERGSYETIVWWSEEDGAFVVEAPELPGCMGHGETRPAAIRNAEDAIGLWIKTAKEDGVEIPQPRGRLVYA